MFLLRLIACVHSTPPAAETDSVVVDSKDATEDSDEFDTSCPVTAAPSQLGTVDVGFIDEASGMVASAAHDDVLWVHNDSGDSARVFALSTSGEHLATVKLPSVSATDWEDMAIGPGSGDAWALYVGDFGDNGSDRPSITVHRFDEPPVADAEVGTEAFTWTYSDGEAHNAESLFVDPLTGDLYIVTKTSESTAQVFRSSAPLSQDSQPTEVTTLDVAPSFTAADISRNGRWILIRGYGTVAKLWVRAPGDSVLDALAQEPCEVTLAAEPQAETVAFASDGSGVYTISEGEKQPVWWHAFE
jgi:hypothetical protein